MDSGKSLIAGGTGALSISFQVIKELTHDRGGKILDGHPVDRDAGTFAREWQQQCQRVAVAGLRVSSQIAFADQVLKKEAADPLPQQVSIIHGYLHNLRTGQSADWLP